MPNSLIFLLHSCTLFIASLCALRFSSYALFALIVVQTVLANLNVLETISLFGLTTTAAEPFTVGAIIASHLLQEYHGKLRAQQAVYTSIAAGILYALMAIAHLSYTPEQACTYEHYHALLAVAPRIAAASVIAYTCSGLLDVYVFSLLKKIFAQRYLPLRNILAAATSQLVDTTLFGTLALYGVVPNVWSIITVSYTVKMIGIALGTPFVGLARCLMPSKTRTAEHTPDTSQ